MLNQDDRYRIWKSKELKPYIDCVTRDIDAIDRLNDEMLNVHNIIYTNEQEFRASLTKIANEMIQLYYFKQN